MKTVWILAGGLVLGFAIGFVVRDLTTQSTEVARGRDTSSNDLRLSRVDDPEGRGEVARGNARRRQKEPRDGDRREDGDQRSRRSRPEALAALKEAIDGDDRGAMHDALRDLSRRGGEPLSTEQLEELGSFLHEVDDHMLEELSRALVMSGGKEGIDMKLVT